MTLQFYRCMKNVSRLSQNGDIGTYGCSLGARKPYYYYGWAGVCFVVFLSCTPAVHLTHNVLWHMTVSLPFDTLRWPNTWLLLTSNSMVRLVFVSLVSQNQSILATGEAHLSRTSWGKWGTLKSPSSDTSKRVGFDLPWRQIQFLPLKT